jgi:dihydropteroate synthase
VARALVRKVGLDAEHAAYLGYEVSKAEIALKLGKTYIQDEDLLVTPWG